MFTQSAFSDLDEAERQLSDFFEGLQTTRSWPSSIVDELVTWVEAVATNNRPRFSWIPAVAAYQAADEPAREFWLQISEEFRTEIDRITNNNPDILTGWNAVAITLGSGSDTAFSTAQSTGVTGALNIAQDSLDEFAVEQRQRNKTWEKWAPIAIPAIGLAALFVTIKAIK
jgi:hypothetical protein